MWAIALSADGQYLASTSYDGRLNVWDLANERKKLHQYDTKGSYGMCIDLVCSTSITSASMELRYHFQSADGRFTATGHENGGIYIFDNSSGRMVHSLPGTVTKSKSSLFVVI